jgi:hypothetical protein
MPIGRIGLKTKKCQVDVYPDVFVFVLIPAGYGQNRDGSGGQGGGQSGYGGQGGGDGGQSGW